MICHPNLIEAFTMFLINDGYGYEVGKNVVYFSKPTKHQVKIDGVGQMNSAADSRYAVFLKIWLQRGKDFIAHLNDQFRMMVR